MRKVNNRKFCCPRGRNKLFFRVSCILSVGFSQVRDFTVKLLPVPHEAPSATLQPETILTSVEKQKLVQRILQSEEFRRAPAMRAFLLYVTRQSELGRIDQLKEQTIGVEVLGRKPDYEPANDNIVRVRAHELRGRLARYFASEGMHEPAIITIPRGAYAPEFSLREVSGLGVAGQPGDETPRLSATEEKEQNRSRAWWLAAVGGALVVISVSILIGTHVSTAGKHQTAQTPSNQAVRDFWSQFLSKPNAELRVVYADSSVALWERLNNRDLNLGDYLSHKYVDGPNSRELLEIVSQRATSPADISTSLHIQSIAAEFGGQLNAQFARNVNADFLHGGNVVLIGSRRSNPWVGVYESNLNFQLRLDPGTRSPYFFNRSPRPHEAAQYGIASMQAAQPEGNGQFIQQNEEKEFLSYGVVALLRGCGSNHLTAVLEGLNLQATQAAGDLVTDPQMLAGLLHDIGHAPGSNAGPFEALFQVTSLPGGYNNPKVIAFRTSSSDACAGG
jgi:hypothetical protein